MRADVILVALGANLPDPLGRSPRETCAWAAEELAALPGLQLDGVSPWYRTRPVPRSDQPDFVNGVARLSGAADPRGLLTALHGIEARAGRVRGPANAPRTLDLDLLAMDGLVICAPDLVLPHPRLQDRLFVLRPLCDVAPGWVHPVLGLRAEALLAHAQAAGPQHIEPLPPEAQGTI